MLKLFKIHPGAATHRSRGFSMVEAMVALVLVDHYLRQRAISADG